MAHFAFTRSPGGWIALSVLFASEMEDIDDKLSKALNADEGGSWTPSSQIVLGGAGLKVIGPVEGTWTPATQIHINGAGLFVSGPMTIADCHVLVFQGTSFAAWENSSVATFQDTTQLVFADSAALLLEETATFTMAGTSVGNVGGINWTWTGSLISHVGTLQGYDNNCRVTDARTTTRTGPTILSGTAAGVGKRQLVTSGVTSNFTPNHFDVVRIHTLLADHTFNIEPPDDALKCTFTLYWYALGTAPSGGTSLGASQAASTHDLTILSSTGSVSLLLIHNPGSVNPLAVSNFYRAEFYFDGTDWNCIDLRVM